jgi:hypothetical protein
VAFAILRTLDPPPKEPLVEKNPKFPLTSIIGEDVSPRVVLVANLTTKF